MDGLSDDAPLDAPIPIAAHVATTFAERYDAAASALPRLAMWGGRVDVEIVWGGSVEQAGDVLVSLGRLVGPRFVGFTFEALVGEGIRDADDPTPDDPDVDKSIATVVYDVESLDAAVAVTRLSLDDDGTPALGILVDGKPRRAGWVVEIIDQLQIGTGNPLIGIAARSAARLAEMFDRANDPVRLGQIVARSLATRARLAPDSVLGVAIAPPSGVPLDRDRVSCRELPFFGWVDG